MKWLIPLLFLCACQKSTPLNHFSGAAFNIGYHIQIGHPLTDSEKRTICTKIQDVFTHIDQTYNHWNPNSEVSRFNASKQTYTVSAELLHLLTMAQTVNIITEGRFDPTLGTLTYAVKHKQSLDGKAGIAHLQIDGHEIKKTAPIRLDLDGISKGHAIDLLALELSQLKYENIYVEWGGEIRTLGKHPTGRPWRVLLNDSPIDLCDASLATSGDSNQQFDGVTHIIDPKNRTPLPVAGHTITVKASTASLADSLATAFMLCSDEEINGIKKSLPDIEVWNENGIL